MTFKIGDRVRVKKSDTSPPTPPNYLGRVGWVVQVNAYGLFEYEVKLDFCKMADNFKIDELEAE